MRARRAAGLRAHGLSRRAARARTARSDLPGLERGRTSAKPSTARPRRTSAKTSWPALERRADRVRDWNGTGLDPKVRPLVVALWAHGLETDFSCQGHVARGAFTEPTVSVAHAQPAGAPPWEAALDGAPLPAAARRRWDAWVRENLAQQRKLLDLLARFHAGREVDPDVQLQVDRDVHWGRCTLRCAAGDVARLLPPTAQRVALRRFQAELASFAAFLREAAS